ncbi:MAG: hypothetical protein CL607_10570 [Anaerolineaceae bacterium]|nr:hypothetical protein [Anaerolineaceae bacterium]
MKEKPKRKGKPAPRYLFWLMGAVAVVWGITLIWGYVSYGTATKTISSTMSFEESITITAQNYVILGTDVPYCDFAAEQHVSSVLTEDSLTAAMLAVPGIETASMSYDRGNCFTRPQGDQDARSDTYVRWQSIEITASIEDSDLARGNLLYAVFNALMPLMPTEPIYRTLYNTRVRIGFVDEAGTELYAWNNSYQAGVSAIEMYDRATIWQQTN